MVATVSAHPNLDALQRDGFVVIRNLLTPDQVQHYRSVATAATTNARRGGWPHFRTVPKQFPPWPSTPPPASEGGIWGVQHLLHPEMAGRQSFAECYFSESILKIAGELMDVQSSGNGADEPLVMELFNLLVAPETKDFELRWHRDDISEKATAEEELAQLAAKSPGGRQSHAQYNLALCPDASLIVIPGSHRRARTEIERNAAPYEPSLPNQLVVKLEPGDAVFYDSNIVHRGVYKGKPEGGEESRLTLHGSIGLKAADAGDMAKNVRATAVLQHGVGAWVHREDAAFGLGARPERMRANLIKTKDRWTKKVHVGLSTYGETPQLVGQDHLKPLIDDALAHVPPSLVPQTPVFLLATAGMRLLPDRQRRQVLDAVCTYLQQETRLLIPDCALHIQVIPGTTEGLYGWIAANYLVGGFDQPDDHDHGKSHHTYGFLDMGGASAQIAFAPNSTEAAKHADNLTLLRLRNIDGSEQEHRVFVTTWLGFGVNEARKQYLAGLVASYPSTTVEYPDPCLPNGVRAGLDSKSLVSTASDQSYLLGTGQFDACLRATLPLLKLDEPCNDSPCLFGQHVPLIDFDVNHFIGVSQYWHTTHEIFRMGFGEDPFDLGAYQARVNDFCTLDWAEIQAAVADKAYGKGVDELSASTVCFKASWLISILRDGLGIESEATNATTSDTPGKDKAFFSPFTAVDTIKNTEVSWTLGKMLLYASSTIPPASSSGNDLPVGFGSNTGAAIPPDWVYPSTTLDPPPPLASPSPSKNTNTGGTTTPRPGPYPLAAIDRAGIALRTESRENILGLALSSFPAAAAAGASAGASFDASTSHAAAAGPGARSKSSSRAATPSGKRGS
ncbi:hypothetical protein DV735_g1507, partial [Chaetothyriales sp. CBS 134920]